MYHVDLPDDRVMVRLARLRKLALAGAVVVPGVIALLWIVPSLASYAPAGWSRMKLATALGILALVAVELAQPGRAAKRNRVWDLLAVGVILVLSVVAILPASLSGLAANVTADLPSPQSAIAFALLSSACLLATSADRRRAGLADFFAIGLFGFLCFMFAGHQFRIAGLIASPDGRLMSLQTILSFILLGGATVCRLMTGSGVLSKFTHRGTGSATLRRLLPYIVATPFAMFGLIAFLHVNGWLSEDQSRALAAPIMVLAALGVVARLGRRINALERQLRQASAIDSLTRVLNRGGLDSVASYLLHNARRVGGEMTVLFFDLDGLKAINDTKGHNAGSRAIRHFAETLVATMRKNDVVARVGGDEFVVLATGDIGSVDASLQRLERNLGELASSDPDAIHLAYSVGYAPVAADARDLEAAIAMADAMMYEDKRRRRTAPGNFRLENLTGTPREKRAATAA